MHCARRNIKNLKNKLNLLFSKRCNFKIFLRNNSGTADKYITEKNRRWKILFFGTDSFSLASLSKLSNEYQIGTQISKLGVVTSSHVNPVHKFAKKLNLNIYSWPLKLPIDSYDIGMVVSFGHLIPEEIIQIFPYGMVNIHASLLPRWRGAAPIIHAIANGDIETGVTLMKIKPKQFDVGELIDQKSIRIPSDIKMPQLHDKLALLGADLLVNNLRYLEEKLQAAKAQPIEGVTYAPKVSPKLANVDWANMTSAQIYDLARALDSLYPLSTKWQDVPVKLYDVNKYMLSEDDCLQHNTNKGVKPSEKLSIKTPGYAQYDKKRRTLKVMCSDRQFISVGKVGVSGKRIMSANDFNNGFIKKIDKHLCVFK